MDIAEIVNKCIYSTQSTWPSKVPEQLQLQVPQCQRHNGYFPQIALEDIPIIIYNVTKNSKRSFMIGWGRMAGGINGLLSEIGCSWRMSCLRWLAMQVNVTMPSKVKYWSTECALSFSRTLVGGSIGNMARMMQGVQCVMGQVMFFPCRNCCHKQ